MAKKNVAEKSYGFDIVRRTFEAKKFPRGSARRIELNRNSKTSEYLPSQKYLLLYKQRFSHGGVALMKEGFATKFGAKNEIIRLRKVM